MGGSSEKSLSDWMVRQGVGRRGCRCRAPSWWCRQREQDRRPRGQQGAPRVPGQPGACCAPPGTRCGPAPSLLLPGPLGILWRLVAAMGACPALGGAPADSGVGEGAGMGSQSSCCCRWEGGSCLLSGLPAAHSGPQVLEVPLGGPGGSVGGLSPFPKGARWGRALSRVCPVGRCARLSRASSHMTPTAPVR